MTHRSNDARTTPIVPDERIRNAIRHHLDLAINIDRTATRQELAENSRVNIHAIDAIMSHDPAKKRRVAAEDLMSLAFVLGDRAVNAFLACMHYGGAERLEQQGAADLSHIVADGLRDMSVIATALADGRIDHTEERDTTAAADHLIATLIPLSSARGRG